MTDYYKILGANGESIHGGKGAWGKPSGARPGKWMDQVQSVRCCSSGYHLVELYSLAEWLKDGCTIYLAEGRGASHSDGSGKTAFAQARLIRRLYISERDLRLFSADCAEHVLPNWQKFAPKDTRVAEAIQAAREFAHNPCEETRSAAWSAASAAESAARSAAGSAAWSAASAARSAARSAAGSAAWSAASAAESAARSAAGSAERQWQSDTLRTYLKDVPHPKGP